MTADPESRAAVLRHGRPASEDPLVLRRALPYLSALEGRLVLHAACVAFPAGAVVFCADARTGKSTLALALDAAGLPVLGDDHVVVERDAGGRFVAHASIPWVEVAAPSVRALRPDVAPARREGPVPLRSRRPDRAPLAALAFLHRGATWGRRSVAGPRRLPGLLKRYAFVGDPADSRETTSRFDAAAALVESVPCVSVTVPEGLRSLHDSLATPRGWWT
jgi:hypothetical protein